MAIIPDVGKLALLTSQYTYLATCKWCLFTTDITVAVGDTYSAYAANEATWTGYARVTVGSLNTAAIVGSRASTTPVTQPTFTNGDVSTKTFYGWFLIDNAASIVVDAVNLGLQTLLVGAMIQLIQTITLKGE